MTSGHCGNEPVTEVIKYVGPKNTWKTRLTTLSSSPPSLFPALSSTRATAHPTFPSGCCTWCGLMHVTSQDTSNKTPTSSSSQLWMFYTGTAKGTPSVSHITNQCLKIKNKHQCVPFKFSEIQRFTLDLFSGAFLSIIIIIHQPGLQLFQVRLNRKRSKDRCR